MFLQILSGSFLLIVCALVHVACVAGGISVLPVLGARVQSFHKVVRTASLLSGGIVVLLAAHTVEIWLWAFAFDAIGAFSSFSTSFYFATVTYTTLGFGDVVAGDSLRIFASFAAITGLLTFGISTAFLIGLLVRVLPSFFDGP